MEPFGQRSLNLFRCVWPFARCATKKKQLTAKNGTDCVVGAVFLCRIETLPFIYMPRFEREFWIVIDKPYKMAKKQKIKK